MPATTVGLQPELIMIVTPSTRVDVTRDGMPTVNGDNDHPISQLFLPSSIRLAPVFSAGKTRGTAAAGGGAGAVVLPDLTQFFRVEAAPGALPELVHRLQGHQEVHAAYIKPPSEPAVLFPSSPPDAAEPPPVTPDFTRDQGYLDAAPGGIDARFAWNLPGGSGAGVNIIDIEGAWLLTHEDLAQNRGGIVSGDALPSIDWRNHGTAVLGCVGADRNGFGVTGISPEADLRTIAGFKLDTAGGATSNSAAAIQAATNLLNPGDILLIEIHRAGPRNNFADSADQIGYIPIEWWPDDLAAVRAAVTKGIIVVAAGGNGGEDLDAALYDTQPSPPFGPFPPWWHNPFRRGAMDSGAIVVGAGAPPPGTHGTDQWGPDRSRLSFSNYGSAIDAQGWGREVTTTGYGSKQGGLNETLWYTDGFAGTSSAAPMIVGALACLQGALRQARAPLLTPATARQILRMTGSTQQDAPDRPAAQRIGNRPDVNQMLRQLLPTAAPPEVPDRDANPQPVSLVKSVRITRTFREKTVTRYYR